jgi:Protein of unknown function (DUF3606)
MADNPKNGGAQNLRVSMDQEHEVRYWTEKLGCSEGELAAAVTRVGHSAEAVRREVLRAWAYGTLPSRRSKAAAGPTR